MVTGMDIVCKKPVAMNIKLHYPIVLSEPPIYKLNGTLRKKAV